MEPVYLDLHIHTSDDPNSLNQNYDLETLILKVKGKAESEDFLISLTDHNTINEKVYLEARKKIPKGLILGVELHIRSHKNEETKAYHCHIYFNFDEVGITEEVIKDINHKLDLLYPNKQPTLKDKDIPDIQQIIETFDEYDFLLLPHGGQTHSTFDEALPEGKEFDNAMQRSIYYNFFDGFTSRSDQRTERTRNYLERLGIHEFVNLITSTDNYKPNVYPNPKQEEALPFIPTWMLAAPTFAGLRLSLSDSSRLVQSHTKPLKWRESIKSISLLNEKIDIDVTLTPGLNVVIGESSSGKTLLVDSLVKKITRSSFEESKYRDYGVDDIEVDYPDGLHPHFIDQNFIITVTTGERKVSEIPIISRILPQNTDARKDVERGKKDLNENLVFLFNTVSRIETLEAEIQRIPVLSQLITAEDIKENILKGFLSIVSSLRNADYSSGQETEDLKFLDNLEERLKNNPFIEHNANLIVALKKEINEMRSYAALESDVKKKIQKQKKEIDNTLLAKEGESRRKKNDFDELVNKMKEYYQLLISFQNTLELIASFSIKASSETTEIEGYKISVENKFKLDPEIIKEELNNHLLAIHQISKFEEITPDKLFRNQFKNNQRGRTQGDTNPTYIAIQGNIYSKIAANDTITYKILTSDGDDFDTLSPGKKTAILLHLILNFQDDKAPLIIDQPEDNLATSYMNEGLVKSIKKMKDKKQIIFVSHNATIPMLGDAQNIILCKNMGDRIEIRSNPLEGKVDNIHMVDHIAKIADGGKASIKKRFKKYNLKSFKE